jgi:hypothetical protein
MRTRKASGQNLGGLAQSHSDIHLLDPGVDRSIAAQDFRQVASRGLTIPRAGNLEVPGRSVVYPRLFCGVIRTDL